MYTTGKKRTELNEEQKRYEFGSFRNKVLNTSIK